MFTNLRIWQRDGAGQDTLSTLHDKVNGALYLGSTETPFALTDSENRPPAEIRASGIWLRTRNGQAANSILSGGADSITIGLKPKIISGLFMISHEVWLNENFVMFQHYLHVIGNTLEVTSMLSSAET